MSDTHTHTHTHPSTTAVRAGRLRDRTAGAVATPIYLTSTFEFDSTDDLEAQATGASEGYLYTRYANPNHTVVERKMAALEGGEASLVFASGMAAISATMMTFASGGDQIVAFRDLYGRAYHLLARFLPRFGVAGRLIETGDYDALEAAITDRTKLIYFETPTNPLLRVVDLERMADLGRRYGVLTAVDATFASPCNQRPIEYGIDLVLHSCTKYLGGHSDLLAGIVTGRAEQIDLLRDTTKTLGGTLDPHAAYLLERGMKTLSVRVAKHNENGMKIAEFLSEHPAVLSVHYPGLPDHPGHEIAARQMDGFGGMLSFEVKGGQKGAEYVLNHIEIGRLAVSLGGVETLACMPMATSHRSMTSEERHEVGITDGMIRLSLGIEDAEDLIEDLRRVLDEIA